MTHVILDTDPGVDDTMAIAYALLHPDIDLLGLTTVFGNINVDLATRNAQFVLDCFGARDVDVVRGAAVPLVQEPRPHSECVHGLDGLGNQYPGSSSERAGMDDAPLDSTARHAQPLVEEAADYIVRMAREKPGEITLIAVGPLTNIAIALRREPALPDLVHNLIIMGGTLDEPGNVSPLAEANFLNDPHAADEVLGASWPAIVVGLDVTHQIMIGDSHLKKLDEQAGKTGSLVWRCSRFYVDFYTRIGAAREAVATGAEPQCAMHDAAAVAYAIMPDAFDCISGPARVVPDGIAVGQLSIDRKGRSYPLPYWEGRPPTQVCLSVDSERVREDFLQTLIQYHHT